MFERIHPYPGLRAFERNEADLFFGRENVVDEMIDKLASTRFLSVLGASGTGKSSLVKTGLLDGLELGLHPAGSEWTICEFTPGGSPFVNLAAALLKISPAEVEDDAHRLDLTEQADLLAETLREGPLSLIEWLESQEAIKQTNLLVLVDQFEEFFRFDDYDSKEEAEAFAKLLIQSSESTETSVHVVITMRAEYLGSCALIPGLAEKINVGTFLTPRMNRSNCRDAIVGPARLFGIDIEDKLVSNILNDLDSIASWDGDDAFDRKTALARRADQLPLMQHLLNRLCSEKLDQNDDEKIALTYDDYERLGGLTGALDNHGKILLSQFDESELDAVRAVFQCLIQGQNAQDAVRRPRSFADLLIETGADRALLTRIVDRFRDEDCNFLRPNLDTKLTDRVIIDLSHESLIRQWAQLNEWVSEETRAANFWQRLSTANRRYREKEGDLLKGLDLDNLNQWWEDIAPSKGWANRYSDDYDEIAEYINLSVRAREKKLEAERERDTRHRNRLRVALATVSGFALLATTAAVWGYDRSVEAENYSEVAATSADDLALGLFERMDEGLKVPIPTLLALITDREESLAKMASATRSDALIRERQIDLLIRSSETLLAAEWIDEAAVRVDALRSLTIDPDTDKFLADVKDPKTQLRVLFVAARKAYQLRDLKKHAEYLDRAQSILQQSSLSELDMLRFETLIVSHAFLAANIVEDFEKQEKSIKAVETLWTEKAVPFVERLLEEGDPSESDRNQVAELVSRLLAQRMAAGNGFYNNAGIQDGGVESDRYLAELEDAADFSSSIGGTTTQVQVNHLSYQIERTNFIRYVLEDAERAFIEADEAVRVASNLFAEDPRSIRLNRMLSFALYQRSAAAKATERDAQARGDLADLKSLTFWWRAQQNLPHVSQIINDTIFAQLEHYVLQADDMKIQPYIERLEFSLKTLKEKEKSEYFTTGRQTFYSQLVFDSRAIENVSRSELHSLLDKTLVDCGVVASKNTAQVFNCAEAHASTISSISQVSADRIGEKKWVELIRSGIESNRKITEIRPENDSAYDRRALLAYKLADSGLIDDVEATELFIEALQAAIQSIAKTDSPSVRVIQNSSIYARKLVNRLDSAQNQAEVLNLLSRHLDIIEQESILRYVASASISYFDRLQESIRARLSELSDEGVEEANENYDQLSGILQRIERLKSSIEVSASTSNEPVARPIRRSDWKELGIDRSSVKTGEIDKLNWSYLPALEGAWRTLATHTEFFDRHPALLEQYNIDSVFAVRALDLPFYENGQLIEIEIRLEGSTQLVSYLEFPEQIYLLKGTSPEIHKANATHAIRLDNPSQVSAYLRFFCLFVNGEDGAFRIIESTDSIDWNADVDSDTIEEVQPLVRPVVIWRDLEKPGYWRTTATVHYSDDIFHAEFLMHPTGMIEMVNDEPVAEELPINPFVVANLRSGSALSVTLSTLNVEKFGIPKLRSRQQEVEYLVKQIDSDHGLEMETFLSDFTQLALISAEHEDLSEGSLNSLAYAMAKKNLLVSDAVSLAEKAVEKSPDRYHYLDTLGFAQILAGDAENALKNLERSEELILETRHSKNTLAEIYAHLALAHHTLGDAEKAGEYIADAEALATTESIIEHIADISETIEGSG